MKKPCAQPPSKTHPSASSWIMIQLWPIRQNTKAAGGMGCESQVRGGVIVLILRRLRQDEFKAGLNYAVRE